METEFCALESYCSQENPMRDSGLAYAPLDVNVYERISRISDTSEVAIPAAFLFGTDKIRWLEKLRASAFKKRLIVALGQEELELASEIRPLLSEGWGLDLIFSRPLNWEDERRLALYRAQDVRLIYIVRREFDSFQVLQSIPKEQKCLVCFLPNEEVYGPYLTADEVILLTNDWQVCQEKLGLPEVSIVVYRPMFSLTAWNVGSQFFAQPDVLNYGVHFLNLGECKWLRLWMVKAYAGKSKKHKIAVSLIFAVVRPIATLTWPIKKAYWYIQFKGSRYFLRVTAQQKSS